MIEKQTKKLNKKQPKKIKISALQKIVNEAIRKRDGDCKIRDGKRQCNGVLTASHYHSVGGQLHVAVLPAEHPLSMSPAPRST